jgi:hypothetical protein
MFERAEPFARHQAARKLESEDYRDDWHVLGEGAGWETERPQPAIDRCSTILPVAPSSSRERWGLDPPDLWLEVFELEGDTPFEPSPGGPDTIPMPFDPLWAPTVRP